MDRSQYKDLFQQVMLRHVIMQNISLSGNKCSTSSNLGKIAQIKTSGGLTKDVFIIATESQ